MLKLVYKMEQNNFNSEIQDKEKTASVNKKTNSEKKREIICFSLGLISIILGITGFTGVYLGEFLTYITAYLFGILYPVLYILLILIGLYLVIKKKLLPFKGHALFVLGLFFVFIATIAFCSYTIASTEEVLFSNFSSFYSSRMSGYSSSPFKIDNPSNISSLGGGFIGLFFAALLKPWGFVGSTIFFIVLILLGLTFMVIKPLRALAFDNSRKEEKHMKYSSPFKAPKGKKNDTAKVTNSNVRESFSAPFAENFYGERNQTAAQNKNVDDIKPAVRPVEQNAYSQNRADNTTSNDNFTVVQNEYNRPRNTLTTDSVNQSKLTRDELSYNNPVSTPKENSYVNNPEPDDYARPVNNGFTTTDYENSSLERDNSYMRSDDISTDMDNHLSDQAEEFRKNFEATGATFDMTEPSSNQGFTTDTPKKAVEVEEEPVKIQREYKLEEEKPEEEISQEDQQRMLEAQYFELKRQQKEAEEQKMREEEEEKKRAVMRYVSSTPKHYNYKLPDSSLLSDIDDSNKMEANIEASKTKGEIINKVFNDYNIKAKVISYTIGASVTRFNVEVEPGFKAEKLTSILDELQRNLNGDKSVRIQTVVEGKTTSGIEIGNVKKMAVSFKKAFREIEKNKTDNLLLPIGQDLSGNIITFPLNEMPHLLVAGTTGSGKSVLVQCMIMTLIMRNYPNQLKLMLIDPKQVEFSQYNLEPHLFCPVVADSEQAVVALQKLVTEMDRRYTILKQSACVKLSEYRAKRVGHEQEMEELPDIVCVIDEFADLMQTAGDEVASCVQRITQKARAAGIYMILATQRPSKDVIPMVIKSNINCRIALSCSSQVDSRVIMDENGAETLLGKGDLLFKSPVNKSLVRAQSAFMPSEEMERVLTYLKKVAGDPNYDPDFLDLEIKNSDDEDEPKKSLSDTYDDIKDYVMCTGICSRSSIMSNFALSLTKADQMIGKLKSEGVVQQIQGGKYLVLKRKEMK